MEAYADFNYDQRITLLIKHRRSANKKMSIWKKQRIEYLDVFNVHSSVKIHSDKTALY